MSSDTRPAHGLRTLALALLLLFADLLLQLVAFVALPYHPACSTLFQLGSVFLLSTATLTALGGLLQTRIQVRELGQRLQQPIVVAVIEWQSDRADDPAVFLGDSVPGVRRPVAAFLARLAAEDSINDVDADWVAENPRPDLDDPAAVAQYLEVLHEQTTDAWVTLYGCGPVSEPGAFLLTYDDVRTGHPRR